MTGMWVGGKWLDPSLHICLSDVQAILYVKDLVLKIGIV